MNLNELFENAWIYGNEIIFLRKKRCFSCGEKKDIRCFSIHKECDDCYRENYNKTQREKYRNDPEFRKKILEKCRKWTSDNPGYYENYCFRKYEETGEEKWLRYLQIWGRKEIPDYAVYDNEGMYNDDDPLSMLIAAEESGDFNWND